MEADFAVELAADDETLEVPWASKDNGPEYYDLKRHPEFLSYIGEFLKAMNSAASILETAKCDVWASTEMKVEEEIFGATHKFCSYVDLIFTGESSRFAFAEHKQFAKRLVELLRKAPEIPAATEILIRRCFYHSGQKIRQGFYVTFYLFGYADDETQARQRWAIALKLVENAIKQVSAR
jgi:hypothetical protein